MSLSEKQFGNIQNPENADVSDFHIKSTDGEIFYCSKIQFQNASDYFRGFFSWSSLPDGKTWESPLHSVVVRALGKWVIVTKFLETTHEVGLKILEGANFYGLPAPPGYGQRIRKQNVEGIDEGECH